MYNYTRLNNKNAFQLGFTIDETKPNPAYFFSFFYIEKGNIAERIVYAIKEDSKWIFFANEKAPLVIEDTNNYLKKK